MRCSSSEHLLDEFVDGTLPPREHALVAAHVKTCDGCAAILTELRAIDGLLLTPRRLEPAANFTFKVMADVRTMPVPHLHHRFPFAALGTYIAFAWLTIAAFLFFGGAPVRASITSLAYAVTNAWKPAAVLVAAVGHVFGNNTYGITAAAVGILGFDLLAAVGVYFLFANLRARRLAAQRSFESC